MTKLCFKIISAKTAISFLVSLNTHIGSVLIKYINQPWPIVVHSVKVGGPVIIPGDCLQFIEQNLLESLDVFMFCFFTSTSLCGCAKVVIKIIS